MSITMILIVIGVIVFFVIPSFQDRVVPVKKIIIMPAIFVYLLFTSGVKDFSVGPETTAIMIAGLAFGGLIMAYFRKDLTIKADKEKQLIGIPGGYASLIIFVAIFSIHFAVGYLQSANPSFLIQNNQAGKFLLFLLASASGLSIGNALMLYKKFHFAKSEDLLFPEKYR